MESIFREVLASAGWAAALALLATVAGRAFRHRPAVVHGLWVLVLLKLATPSLVHWTAPALANAGPKVERAAPPSRRAIDRAESAGVSRTPRDLGPIPLPARSAEPPGDFRPPWRIVVVGAWILGLAIWWLALARQVARFRRLLATSGPAPGGLQGRVDRLADRLGVRRSPEVRLVPARIPPLLWAMGGRPRLLIPDDLWSKLDEAGRETILVHELAHLGRRDHRVRWLEAAVLGLYWWDPIAWWARRRVEEAEELCCDAWVAWALPGRAEAYAEALVRTAVFLSGPRPPRPLGASGVGGLPPLRRRLTMILGDSIPTRRPRPFSRAAVVLGACSLAFLPAWAPGRPASPLQQSPAAPGAAANPDPPVVQGPAPAASVVPAAVPGGAWAVARPLVRDLPRVEEFLGRFEPARSIEIRARVGGIIEAVHFEAGRTVDKGDLLFEIDPTPYAAEVEKAEAEVARATANLARLTADLNRANNLLSRNAMGRDEYDRAVGDQKVAEANLKGVDAGADQARRKLASARVVAPIRGRLGNIRFSAGNLATADTTVLATIDAPNPMEVVFDIDERTALAMRRGRRERTDRNGIEEAPPVEVKLISDPSFDRRGHLSSVESRFDPATGTLRCRATVENPDGMLMPGMSAQVQLAFGPAVSTMLVPRGAVLTGENGKWSVMVVDDSNVARGRSANFSGSRGEFLVVASGLKAEEWIVLRPPAAFEGGLIKVERVAIPDRGMTPP